MVRSVELQQYVETNVEKRRNVSACVVFLTPSVLKLTFATVNPCGPVVALRTTKINIQQFYVLLTQCIYVLCGSENKQRLFPYTALNDWFVQLRRGVYCAVRTGSLYIIQVMCFVWI